MSVLAILGINQTQLIPLVVMVKHSLMYILVLYRRAADFQVVYILQMEIFANSKTTASTSHISLWSTDHFPAWESTRGRFL